MMRFGAQQLLLVTTVVIILALPLIAKLTGQDAEVRDAAIAMAVVIGGIVLASRLKPKAPSAPVSGRRRDLELPEYVLNWRYFRWPLLGFGLALSGLFGTEIFVAIALAMMAVWEASVSRRYHDEDRLCWEIAFYSEEDGFCEGDGDGDGGGD